MYEVIYGEIKSMISDYGQADAERIAARLSWGPERLMDWLNHARHGFDLDADDLPALRHLCANGINAPLGEIGDEYEAGRQTDFVARYLKSGLDDTP